MQTTTQSKQTETKTCLKKLKITKYIILIKQQSLLKTHLISFYHLKNGIIYNI